MTMMDTKDMTELWKKAFLVGLGATALTVEKIQEFVNEMVDRGEMSRSDASSFADDLKQRAIKEKEQLEARIKDMVDQSVKATIKGLGLVTREEFEAFKAEMAGSSKSRKK
jgi:polyhydroxyalkanoate synthesis regulator phasin